MYLLREWWLRKLKLLWRVGKGGFKKTKVLAPSYWLRPDLVPPAPYLDCPQDNPPGWSGVLVQPALIGGQSWKAGMPFFFGGKVKTLSLLIVSSILLGNICSRHLLWSFLSLRVRTFML